MSVSNFALSVVTDHSRSGPGLPSSLRKLSCPRCYHLQLLAFILLISAVHQAEIKPRLVRANHVDGAASYSVPCKKSSLFWVTSAAGTWLVPAGHRMAAELQESEGRAVLLHRTCNKLGLQPGAVSVVVFVCLLSIFGFCLFDLGVL